MKRAAIYTLGCRLNQTESALIADHIAAAGYHLVSFHEPCDLGIINTCTVTAEADAKSRKAIRGFIRRNPRAFLAVIGCYSQLAAGSLARIPGVDLVVGNKDKLRLMEFVGADKNPSAVVVCEAAGNGDFRVMAAANAPPLSRRRNLKVQEGCDVRCAYCIVPDARGASRSRDFDDAVNEARQLTARGARELVVTGINVGAYEHGGRRLLDLVDALNDIGALARIRIGSIELGTVDEALFARMGDPRHKLAPFLHIPLQSGSDRVLERMRRPYTALDFRTVIERADTAVRDLCIGTDILVGFPGETDEDLAATCNLLAESPIAYAHVFKYSDRAGAPAATFAGKLDPGTIHRRSERVRQVSDAKWRAFCEQFAGRTLPVLFEQEETGFWSGYTGNYIRVFARSDSNLENRICEVRLDAIAGDGMIGTIA